MGPLQLTDQVVQNHQTGEQMTHWDMLNKENWNLVALFNMCHCVNCSPVRQFCTMWSLSCKGPINPPDTPHMPQKDSSDDNWKNINYFKIAEFPPSSTFASVIHLKVIQKFTKNCKEQEKIYPSPTSLDPPHNRKLKKAMFLSHVW